MRRFKVNAFTLGILAGLLLVLGSGNAFFAHAVLSGKITNPTFGPQSDDVTIQVPLDCKIVQSPGGSQTATCSIGYTLTGGGGACADTDDDNPEFIPDVIAGTYYANCDGGGGETAWVVCCK